MREFFEALGFGVTVVGGGCAIVVFEGAEADVGWHGLVSSLGWLVFWWV